MKNHQPFTCLRLVLLLALLAGVNRAFALDTNQVLESWFTAQKDFQSWSADLTQTRSLAVLAKPLSSPGRVWFRLPNQFRWELGSPAQTIVLRRTNDLLVAYPRLKRLERFAFADKSSAAFREVLPLLEAGFPRSRRDLEAQFQVLSVLQTNAAYALRLQPRSTLGRRLMREIRLSLHTNDFNLASTELLLADGSTLVNTFTNARINPPLEDALFDYQPGPGFQVVEPLRSNKP